MTATVILTDTFGNFKDKTNDPAELGTAISRAGE